MFREISGSYDLMNRLITFGFDRSWRRYVVRMASLPEDGKLLDVGTGTGDVALEALRSHPTLRVAAGDYTFQMMVVGRGRPGGQRVWWHTLDVLNLPFPDKTFDAVTSAYLVRNVTHPGRAFEEQMRVIKPGGRVVCLDTSPPPRNVLTPLVLFHLGVVIPLLGAVIAGNRAAYTYLPSSTQAFMTPEKVASLMRGAGLVDVSFRKFMLGTQVVHRGRRGHDRFEL